MKNYFLDETKIEADANKYSFVWRKTTKKVRGKVERDNQGNPIGNENK